MKNSLIGHYSTIKDIAKVFTENSSLYKVSSLLLALSRLLQVVSFFLPLKILILLSSKDNMPKSFSYLPFDIEYRNAMIFIIALVPVTYLGYIASGIMHRYYLDKDLSIWGSSYNKITSFKVKSKGSFIKLHGHIAKMYSETILLILSLILTVIIDAWIFVFLFMLILLNMALFVKKAFYINDHERIGFLRLHRKQYIEYLSSISFIAIFAVLAFQLKFTNIGVFQALFILLISRMVFQSVQRFSMENIYIIAHAK